MKKFKCTFYPTDMLRIVEIFDDEIKNIHSKDAHELSEIMVYRLDDIIALRKKFYAKSMYMHPSDRFNFSFGIKNVLTLKYCLFNKMNTPGLRMMFDKINRYIHPAIQLEL